MVLLLLPRTDQGVSRRARCRQLDRALGDVAPSKGRGRGGAQGRLLTGGSAAVTASLPLVDRHPLV
jgi:hypothetical protein